MVQTSVAGKIHSVIYAMLEPGEDIYRAILQICRDHGVETGLVLNIVGGLTQARLNLPVAAAGVEVPPGKREWKAGVIECAGIGIIGRMVGTFDMEKTAGVIHRDGEPYIHVHMTIKTPEETVMGHLIEGCIVRSVHPSSHFTIAIAKVEGIDFTCQASEEKSEHYPSGFPIHALKSLAAGS